MSEYVLTVENLKKSFGSVVVLNEAQIKVKPGEIHGLVGENGAGKTTMMNIVAGVHQRDRGKICLDGKEVNFSSPREACHQGVGFVHQEMSLCPDLSVAENVFMWDIPELPGGFVDFKKLYSDTDEILQSFGIGFDARAITGNLKVADQQVVEIARALSMHAKLIIFDEPTSSLTENEAANLFTAIRKLKERRVGIVYISHRMPELFNLCDSVTVLRDGKFVDSMAIKDVTPDEVILKMVGRDIGDYYPPKSKCITDEELLKVEKLSGEKFHDVSFTLKKGEILGFSGLIGAGRTEVMQSICGFGFYDKGSVTLKGEQFPKNMKSKEIIKRGLFYLSEDRKENGLFLSMSTRRNISVTVLDRFSKFGFLDIKKEEQISKEMIKNLDIRVASDEISVGSVSGGNQQKIMVSKWIVANPKVLIMDEPTRGIDVGSKSEIHHKLRKFCDDGIGVIVVSSEMPEIIGLCDRVIVMHEGVVVGEVSGEDINEEKLMLLASNRIKKECD